MRHVGKLMWPVLLLLAGCGMEAVDIRAEARGEAGLRQFPVEIVEGEYVCPHVVSINNQAFDVKAVIRGEVEDSFGPFVPCLTKVSGQSGTCPNCKNEYRIGGEQGEDGPPQAVPMLRCPHQHDDAEGQLIDPASVFVKGSKDSLLGYTNCPKCKNYFTVKETDLLATIDVPEEMVCTVCKKPVDPTMNACTNKSCKTGGVVRNIPDFEGPCWRCGGMGMCPNCKGSGSGNLGIFDKSPAECWTCGTEGRCPECDGSGFSRYEGTLPKVYKAWGGENALPSDRRKWKWKHDQAADSGGGDFSGGGDEDLGDGPEAPDDGGGDDSSADDSGGDDSGAADSGDGGEDE